MLYIVIGLVILFVFLLGPRETVTLFWRPEASLLHSDKPLTEITAADLRDLQSKIAQQESWISGIQPGTEKQITFSSNTRPKRTRYSVLYVHGFSASRQEIAPVPQTIAKNLHANLYETRLTGHGLTGADLANAKANDWIHDIAEAWVVANQLGEQVIIVSTSTGGTLSAWLAQQAEVKSKLAGLILISPNFQPVHWAMPLLLWPWARIWAPKLFGTQYSWVPSNEGGEKYWTYRYPTSILHDLTALVRSVRVSSVECIEAPSLFIYSAKDRVVRSDVTDRMISRWGAPITHKIALKGQPNDKNHVIVGDIVNPSANEKVTKDVMTFIKTQIVDKANNAAKDA